MKKIILLLAIPAFLLIACDSTEDICSSFSFVESDISDEENYLIIKAIVEDFTEGNELSHISQETHFMTDSSRFALYFKSENIGLEPEMIADYIEMNSVSFNWDDSFDTDQDLISKEELDCLFDNNGWNGFYEKYPDSKGYLKFGVPIQNDNNEALVTFELLCYWECSSGHTAILIKENGKWKVRDVITVWIS